MDWLYWAEQRHVCLRRKRRPLKVAAARNAICNNDFPGDAVSRTAVREEMIFLQSEQMFRWSDATRSTAARTCTCECT